MPGGMERDPSSAMGVPHDAGPVATIGDKMPSCAGLVITVGGETVPTAGVLGRCIGACRARLDE